jgi:hypothetical protein
MQEMITRREGRDLESREEISPDRAGNGQNGRYCEVEASGLTC